MNDIFLVCPIRIIETEELEEIRGYIQQLESDGINGYWSYRDTDQTDSIGDRILSANRIPKVSVVFSIYGWHGR